jgi:hypothetical protein
MFSQYAWYSRVVFVLLYIVKKAELVGGLLKRVEGTGTAKL